MATRLQFPGLCTYCGAEVTRKTAAEHLAKCKPRLAALKKAGRPSPHFPEEVFHIRAEATYLPEFWLDLEIRGETTFGELDHYLRAIWLECCGHMSAFEIGGTRFEPNPDQGEMYWGPKPRSMAAKAASVLQAGTTFTHDYDFGSTTRLQGRAHGMVAAGTAKISVLARNATIVWPCDGCGVPATRVCPYCFAMACASCKAPCKCGDFGDVALPVVDSPRMGVCGYCG